MVALGSKITVYTLEEESLDAIAFLDHGIFTHALRTLKNFILIGTFEMLSCNSYCIVVLGDPLKSTAFLCFQEDPPKLFLLGKDYLNYSQMSNTVPLSISHVSFVSSAANGCISSNTHSSTNSAPLLSLTLLAADLQQNLHAFYYQPEHPASMGGLRLLRSGDYYLGSIPLSSFAYSRYSTNDSSTYSSNVNLSSVLNLLTCLALKNGSVVHISAIHERTYKRLTQITSKLKKTHHEHLNKKRHVSYDENLEKGNINDSLDNGDVMAADCRSTGTILTVGSCSPVSVVLSGKAFRTIQSTSSLLGYTRPLRNIFDVNGFLSFWSLLAPSQRDYLCKTELGLSLDKLSLDILSLTHAAPF